MSGNLFDMHEETQQMDKQFFFVTMGAKKVFFINELKEMNPVDIVNLYKDGSCCILGQSEDYGLKKLDDNRSGEEILFRNFKALEKDEFRLISLMMRKNPLSTMSVAHKDLYNFVQCHADKLHGTPNLDDPVTDAAKLAAIRSMLDKYWYIHKAQTDVTMTAHSLKSDADEISIITRGFFKMDESTWPNFMFKFKQMAFNKPENAVELLNRLATPFWLPNQPVFN